MKKQSAYLIIINISLATIVCSCKKENISNGSQNWSDKNLDVSSYRNGDVIPEVENNLAWLNLTTGAWCYYNNDPSNGNIYGKLYNWYAVNDSRGLAPIGYHIPTEIEWTTLTDYLGGQNVTGGKMKESGTAHWLTPNTGATNSSGFTALPGGYRANDGSFVAININGDYWSSLEDGAFAAYYRHLYYKSEQFLWSNGADKRTGYSVRCLKD